MKLQVKIHIVLYCYLHCVLFEIVPINIFSQLLYAIKQKIKCILLRLNNTCELSNVEDVKLAFRQNGKTVSMWGLRTFGTFSASSIKHLSRLSSSCALRLTFINCKNQILIIKTWPYNFETKIIFQRQDYRLEESTCMTSPSYLYHGRY